jgi:hypothetical protein
MYESSVARLFDLTPAGIVLIETALAPVRGLADTSDEEEIVEANVQ